MNHPLISVIICVYNGGAFLEGAIQCVLAQSFLDYELIVVDDGSTDRTAQIAESHREVTLLKHETNLGPASARNTGIRSARGQYIAFLDADDRWPPHKLEVQIQFHRDHPEYRYSFGIEKFIYENLSKQPNWTKKKVFRDDHIGYVPSSMLIEQSLFDEVGLFNPAYFLGDLTDWIFRAKDQGYVGGIIPEVLLYRGIHMENVSSDTRLYSTNLLKAVKSSIARQKKTNSGE